MKDKWKFFCLTVLRFLPVSIGLLLISLSVNGQHLSAGEASEFAAAWFSKNNPGLKASALPDTVYLEKSLEEKNIYLAGFGESGFIIFSNEESPLILGYSFEGPLPADEEHPLFTEWLPSYSKQLSHIAGTNYSVKSAGPSSAPKLDEAVEPLIEAKWGQGNPWNKYCPSDESGHHAPVGCVAVALAQIMHKWQWPAKGRGSNSYIPPAHREYGTVSAVFDTTYYLWEQMHNTQPTDAASLILFHAGVATYMNYAPNESGANSSVYAPNALKNNFLYKESMILREKGQNGYEKWTQLLRQELVNGRPVLYRGSNPDNGTGHAFNIDGFRDEYFFHFNWGWNGWGNGYYRLEAMADGGGNFTGGQAALFGIQPSTLPLHDRPFSLEGMAGDGFVQLFWDEPLVNNLSHYNVYRNGELLASTPKTRYMDEGLDNRTVYIYHITAEYLGDEPGESLPTPGIKLQPWEIVSFPYSQNFNAELAGWHLGGTTSSFQWARADSLGFAGNNSRIIGIRSDSAGPGHKVADYLISPLLDIRGIENAAVKFDYVFQQVYHVDYLFLMYRRYDNGLWYPISKMDTTDSWNDWQSFYIYFPEEAKNTMIQLGFFYTDYNGVGKGAAIDNVELFIVPDPPVPGFSLSREEICRNETVTVTHESTGNITHWFWDFGESAEPRYAYDAGPHEVSYTAGGPKSIHLVLNHLDHLVKANIVDIFLEPRAYFSYEREGLLISFNNLSENASFVNWSFGDGGTSTEINPVYQFRSKLVFNVEMISFNPPCEPDTMRIEIDLSNGTGIEELKFDESIRVYPNPAISHMDISWVNTDPGPVYFDLISYSGSVAGSWTANNADNLHISLSGISRGLYLLKIRMGEHITYRKAIIY